MRLETLQNGTATYSNISDGVAGNVETALQMVNLVNNTVQYDLGFNRDIKTYFANQGYNPYESDEKVLSQVFNFVKSHVRYIPDKSGRIESISDARETLKLGLGDCDDLTALAATILGVLGYENVNFIVATFKNEGHIYLEVYGRNKQRYVMDLSLPNAQFNVELNTALTKQSIPVFHQNFKQALAGVVHSIKTNTKQIAFNTINSIPYAIQFMPLGIVSANLLQQGINLISGADLSQLSLNELGKKICNELDELAVLIINRQIADNYATLSAMQISSQLGTYQPRQNELEDFQNVKDIIKEKVKYIYYLVDVTPELHLNTKGMIFTGCVIVGFISYRLFKKGKF